MPSTVRLSDEMYELALQAAAPLGRTLTFQLEHWARLGAALDAAGVTMAQTLQLLGADPAVTERMVRLVARAQSAGRQHSALDRVRSVSSKSIAARRSALERQVRSGRRSAESLLMLGRDQVKAARFTFPDEASESTGW